MTVAAPVPNSSSGTPRRRRFAPILAAILPAALTLAAPGEARILDRSVARFVDPEATEGSESLRFVTMRELVLETWLLAYERSRSSDSNGSDVRLEGFDDKQLRAALERHVVEAVLSDRPLPHSAEARIRSAIAEAQLVEVLTIGGESRLQEALLRATGSGPRGAPNAPSAVPSPPEYAAILLRRARAEVYLEVAVSPPVDISDAELRAAQAKAPPPINTMPFEQAAPTLRTLARGSRLHEAAQAYYQAVRSRLRLEITVNGSPTASPRVPDERR